MGDDREKAVIEALREWAKSTLEMSEKLYDEAEKEREDSHYTDIDALEQSVANEAVISTINAMEHIINKTLKGEPWR